MMALSATEIVTKSCRIAFPALAEPKPVYGGGAEPKYQAALLFPPDYDIRPLVQCVEAAMVERWGKAVVLNAPHGVPLRAVNNLAEDNRADGYCPDWHYTNARSIHAPKVVNSDNQLLSDAGLVHAGCWCCFYLRAYAGENDAGNRGVSFSLEGVQFVREDVRLGDDLLR